MNPDSSKDLDRRRLQEMTDKHDFEGALKRIEEAQSWRDAFTIQEQAAIQTALRLAHRLQNGEVSENMREEGYIANIGPAGTFTAMAAQMIKEEG